MSSTLLEVTRASHEEVERLERLVVKDLQTEPPTNKDRLHQSHRVRFMIEQIMDTTHKLVEIYEDKDSARKDEIAALGGQSTTSVNVNVFSAFYDRLEEIREYHRRHPAARYVDTTDEYEHLLQEEPVIEFSGEEAFGRYLDLHELYNDYINSKFGQKVEYSAYLDVFSDPGKILRNLKLTGNFWNILKGFLSVQNLYKIFKEYFRRHLSALGLKTGGTLQQRAERRFLTKNTPLEKLDRKHFAKGSCGHEQNGGGVAPQPSEDAKEIALMESEIKKLCDLLEETIVRTKENIEKKHALTYDEIVQEREEILFSHPVVPHPK